MYVVRPVELADVDALESLAALMTSGVHTLPRTRDTIGAFVERSIASFAAQVDIPSEESYLFVLEDGATGEVVGTAAVHASAGSNGTYFAFRNDVIAQVSRDLNISHSVHALTLCSELTACSQLAGFHLRDREHAGIEAALLSRARLLYAVLAPHRFGDLDAERVIGGSRNRTMIVELMPHYPVYVPLLPGDAQAAMGQIHPGGQLAFDLLTAEGFEADEYVDIFDGGPILAAHKMSLRSFCGSQHRRVENAPAEAGDHFVTYAVATNAERFRAITVACPPCDTSDAVCLPPEAQQALGVVAGDSVICVRI
jgi:arginine N-succinyltransferase